MGFSLLITSKIRSRQTKLYDWNRKMRLQERKACSIILKEVEAEPIAARKKSINWAPSPSIIPSR